MDARELRIGNYVTIENAAWYDLKDVPLMVTQVKIHKDDMFPNSTGMVTCCQLKDWKWDYSQFDEFIRPIPLTEEWVNNFGFLKEHPGEMIVSDKKLAMWYHWVKGAFNVEVSDGKIVFEVYSHYIHVKYVHQLQNIYFALTETELVLQERGQEKV